MFKACRWIYIFLFTYGSLNDTPSGSYDTVFNGGMISEKLIGKDLQH
jgi:hypothetical protein